MPTSVASWFEIRFLRSAFMKLPDNLHWVFLLYSLPLVAILAIWTPPYQSADELAHYFRAYQVAHGRFFGGTGGFVPVAVEQLYGCASALPFHPKERYTPSEQAGAAKVQWTDTMKYEEFPNTQEYAPTGYIPQALAIVLGHAIRASALHTLILARMLNGGAAIILCAISLFLVPGWQGRHVRSPASSDDAFPFCLSQPGRNTHFLCLSCIRDDLPSSRCWRIAFSLRIARRDGFYSGHGTRTATLRPTGIGTFHSGVVVPRAEDTLLDHRSCTQRISCNGHSSLVGGLPSFH